APRRLEKQLWPLGCIDSIIKVATSRGLTLFDTRAATAIVGHARSPDVLFDRRRESGRRVEISHRLLAGGRANPRVKIGIAEKLVPVSSGNRIEASGFIDKHAASCAIELHVVSLLWLQI